MQNTDDLATLRELNRNYVRSVLESDVRWFEANLAQDFMNSNPDGTLVDRAAFLRQVAPLHGCLAASAGALALRFGQRQPRLRRRR